MPRMRKCRRVCRLPQNRRFHPEQAGGQKVTLGLDQLEAMRLCDLLELSQDEAAEQMGVSRGTFQRILYSARKTVTNALCEGYGINIEGGDYIVEEQCCKCAHCKQCKQK